MDASIDIVGRVVPETNTSFMVPQQAVSLYTVPGAVHFDGLSWLQRGAALSGVATTQSKFIFSVWTKLTNGGDGLMADGTDFFSQGATTLNGFDFFNFLAALSGGDGAYFDSEYLIGGPDPQGAPMTSTSWQHVLASLDRTIPAANLRINNVDVFANASMGVSTGFTVDTDFFFANDSFGVKITGDIAEVQLWFGQYADFSIPTNVAYFYNNGNAVNPAIAAAQFGTPTILFSGNSTNFPTNQGSGGPFTLHGSLSNASSTPP